MSKDEKSAGKNAVTNAQRKKIKVQLMNQDNILVNLTGEFRALEFNEALKVDPRIIIENRRRIQ